MPFDDARTATLYAGAGVVALLLALNWWLGRHD